jgi:hypothetical protein
MDGKANHLQQPSSSLLFAPVRGPGHGVGRLMDLNVNSGEGRTYPHRRTQACCLRRSICPDGAPVGSIATGACLRQQRCRQFLFACRRTRPWSFACTLAPVVAHCSLSSCAYSLATVIHSHLLDRLRFSAISRFRKRAKCAVRTAPIRQE